MSRGDKLSVWTRLGLSTLGVGTLVTSLALPVAFARDPADCQLEWGRAVRSYLTQNRTKGPEDVAWEAACEFEGRGDKAGARVEAIMIGAQALAKLDPKGCRSFMKSFVQSSAPDRICDAALSAKPDEVRKLIKESSPPPPSER